VQSCASSSVLGAPEKDMVAYISGYVAKKLSRIVCDMCKSDITQERQEPGSFFISAKQYPYINDGGLTIPSILLQCCLKSVEIVLRDSINSMRVATGVRFRLVKKMTEATQDIPLDCRSERKCQLKFLSINPFTTIRLHHFLRCLNRDSDSGGYKLAARRKASTFAHA